IIAGGSMFAALALLAIVLAYWGWRWFGPAPVVIPQSDTQAEYTRRISAAHLFGTRAPVASAGESAAVSGELRLLGVFAQQDGRGYALFRGARGALLAAAGTDVVPGVRVEAVRPGGVTLIESGARREIALRSGPPADKPRIRRTGSAHRRGSRYRCVAFRQPIEHGGQRIDESIGLPRFRQNIGPDITVPRDQRCHACCARRGDIALGITDVYATRGVQAELGERVQQRGRMRLAVRR